MKYLHLKFENACLKHAECKKTLEGKAGDSSLKDIKGTDWSNPIGVDQISNMLHVMFGLPPKASKRKTIFKRNPEIYEMAKGAYIKYDNYDPQEIMRLQELFQTSKGDYNAHNQISCIIDGQTVSGHYTWNYFERRFKGEYKKTFDDIINFFSELVGVNDVRKYYYFTEFIEEFHKHLHEKSVKDFINNIIVPCKGPNKPINTPILNLFTNTYDKNNGSNCSYNQPTPLLLSRGIGKKVSFNGEIIVPIENDDYVRFLEEWGTLPTLLDGGVVTVISITKKPQVNDLEDEFMPIFKRKK